MKMVRKMSSPPLALPVVIVLMLSMPLLALLRPINRLSLPKLRVSVLDHPHVRTLSVIGRSIRTCMARWSKNKSFDFPRALGTTLIHHLRSLELSRVSPSSHWFQSLRAHWHALPPYRLRITTGFKPCVICGRRREMTRVVDCSTTPRLCRERCS